MLRGQYESPERKVARAITRDESKEPKNLHSAAHRAIRITFVFVSSICTREEGKRLTQIA